MKIPGGGLILKAAIIGPPWARLILIAPNLIFLAADAWLITHATNPITITIEALLAAWPLTQIAPTLIWRTRHADHVEATRNLLTAIKALHQDQLYFNRNTEVGLSITHRWRRYIVTRAEASTVYEIEDALNEGHPGAGIVEEFLAHPGAWTILRDLHGVPIQRDNDGYLTEAPTEPSTRRPTIRRRLRDINDGLLDVSTTEIRELTGQLTDATPINDL